MFASARAIISFSVLPLPLLATAISVPGGSPPPSYACPVDTDSLICCDSTESASDASLILATSGIDDIVEGPVGINCNPIVGGLICTKQPVCCIYYTIIDDFGITGIAFGCTPIIVNI